MKRRKFLHQSTVLGAAFYIVPSHAVAGLGHKPPSDKLHIAGIGVGGKGRWNLRAMESENIVALCDVDLAYSDPVFKNYPQAARYTDWRKMFDKMRDNIDAVMIATPDHTHAVIAAHAMTLNYHVFCQKPLTHSIYESRLLA